MQTIPCMATALLIITLVLQDEMQETEAYALFKEKRDQLNVCGKKLMQTLDLLCNGHYNSMYKKSEETATENDDFWARRGSFGQLPFRSREEAYQLIPSSYSRRRRGVADECCRKSCTFDEIKSYCAN